MFTPSKRRAHEGHDEGRGLSSFEYYQRELENVDKSTRDGAADDDGPSMKEEMALALTEAKKNLKRSAKKINKLKGKLEALAAGETAALATLDVKLKAAKATHESALNACLVAQERVHKMKKMEEEVPRPARIPEASMLPRKLTISLAMSRRIIVDFLENCETAFGNARFPQEERLQGGKKAFRWSSMLCSLVQTKEETNSKFVASLAKLPWKKAKEALILRFATRSDKFHACPAFIAVKQKQGESVTAYAERFEALLRDTLGPSVVVADGGAGLRDHFIYQYFFQFGLLTPIKEALVADPKYAGCQTEPVQVLEICQQKERTIDTAALLLKSIQSISSGGGGGGRGVNNKGSKGGAQGQGHGGGAGAGGKKKPAPTRAAGAANRRCPRCKRDGHEFSDCTAMFSDSGFRLDGIPPGRRGDKSWRNEYKGCSKCKGQDHLAKACTAQRGQLRDRARQAPAVRAMRLETRKFSSLLGKRARESSDDGEGAERDDASEVSPAEELDGAARAGERAMEHEGAYGCTLCGEDHRALECPEQIHA
jgi:hypothetical protein